MTATWILSFGCRRAGPAAIGQLWLFIAAALFSGAIYAVIRPVDPSAQLSMRRATQSLPNEQEQRLAAVDVVPPWLDPEIHQAGPAE